MEAEPHGENIHEVTLDLEDVFAEVLDAAGLPRLAGQPVQVKVLEVKLLEVNVAYPSEVED